jgi:rhamnopyranosyl-N-acetylglucosaminyl-diphospho-decaprenol beta-1,3/1,4-galactofuranosyltransferase
VLAVVLTHNAPESLARCLEAIRSQDRAVDRILVVDNASDPPAKHDVEVLRSDENGGPAGGWALGLQAFLDGDEDAVWLLDDDCEPAADCLRLLLSAAEDKVIAYPVPVDHQGNELVRYTAWWGPLLRRSVVERLGLPMAELFWWREDAEYLGIRPERVGVAISWVAEAAVVHNWTRRMPTKPAWKFYYETRNTIYSRLYLTPTWWGYWRLIRTLIKIVGVIVFREPHKALKLAMVGRGAIHGVRGRLGKTVDAVAYESADRYAERFG